MLTGTRVMLRAPAEADLPFLAQLRNDLDLQLLLMAQPRPNTPDRVRRWLSDLLNDGGNAFFVIETQNHPCGYVQVVRMNFLHGVGELGLCLQPDAHGQSVASEALALVETYARDVFNLRKLTLQVLSDNARAVRFYEKSGFGTVGVWKEHFYQRSAFHDVTLMEKFLNAEPSP